MLFRLQIKCCYNFVFALCVYLKKIHVFCISELVKFLQFHTLCNKVCYKIELSFSVHKVLPRLFRLAMFVLGTLAHILTFAVNVFFFFFFFFFFTTPLMGLILFQQASKCSCFSVVSDPSPTTSCQLAPLSPNKHTTNQMHRNPQAKPFRSEQRRKNVLTFRHRASSI